MAEHEALIVIAGAFLTAACCQWLAWRVNLPAILFLLLAGMLAGPVLGALDPDRLLGDLLLPFVSLSVAIILFEGSITLKFHELRGIQGVVRNMLTFGLVITWLITTVAAHLITGLGWEIAFLFGAITVVTGPTVIAPLLRAVRPTPAVAGVLRWEGIVIDPIGVGLAVLVFEFIVADSTQQAWSRTVLVFAQIVGVGALIGVAAGYLFGLVLRNRALPDFLQNVATLTMIFVTFVLADTLQPESGLVTVTVFGVWLANMPGVALEEILRFKENLSVLLISLLFLLLTARLDLAALIGLGWGGVIVFLILQFLARPVNVLLSSLGSRLRLQERLFLAWVAPRGIVAAAISSLFALKLESAGFADAHLLVPLTFTIIIGTVLLQSATAPPLARLLGITKQAPSGFLIIGANAVARAVGTALARQNVRVLLADTDRNQIKVARQEGLETYQGNPFPDYADQRLNLAGIGTMLALSPDDDINYAAALRYRQELGRNNLFIISGDYGDTGTTVPRWTPSHRLFNRFCKPVSYRKLHELLTGGAEIRGEVLPQQHTLDAPEQCDTGTIPLFFTDPDERIIIYGSHLRRPPPPGSMLYSLYPSDNAKST
jgi:CPA1 family monovalent cation:H+ antiporter